MRRKSLKINSLDHYAHVHDMVSWSGFPTNSNHFRDLTQLVSCQGILDNLNHSGGADKPINLYTSFGTCLQTGVVYIHPRY